MDFENYRYFVNSRGILKSCDIHSNSYISSTTRINDYNVDWSNFPDNSSIYVCSYAIRDFVFNILPKIKNKFILVSGDSDVYIPVDLLNHNEIETFINDDRLIHWFSQNSYNKLEKISQIPIGMDYHTMSICDCWGPKKSPKSQEDELLELVKSELGSKPFYERNGLCYSNFHFCMTTRYGYDRKDALDSIPKELVYYEPVKVERYESWKKQIEYSFVISPHGNGLDCHRTWEALCLGCIPIVKTSVLDSLFENLPVLIVKDWKDVNKELLKNTLNSFKNSKFSNSFKYEELTLKYWMDKINSLKDVKVKLK